MSDKRLELNFVGASADPILMGYADAMRAQGIAARQGSARAPTRRRRLRALTLLEGLIASVILAMVVVAVSQAVLAAQMQTADGVHRARAIELAEAMMDEIVRLPYDDPNGASNPGPESGELARTGWDNLDDYHGLTESAGTVKDSAGLAYGSTYADFSRSVTVVADSENVPEFGGTISGVRITVTVTDSRSASWSVEQFCPEPSASP